MQWNDAVLDGVRRLCLRKNVCLFSRQWMIQEELPQIVQDTLPCKGKTPEQTLSFTLQQLRKGGL